jgi:uncharacterized protein YidB (DUF937 family)
MGILSNVIRTAVISGLGAKLAKGRSPIVAGLMMLLVSKALSKREDKDKATADGAPVPGTEDGLGGLVEKFRQGGLEDLIKSWIGTGPNKPIAPNQLHQALGPETVDGPCARDRHAAPGSSFAAVAAPARGHRQAHA